MYKLIKNFLCKVLEIHWMLLKVLMLCSFKAFWDCQMQLLSLRWLLYLLLAQRVIMKAQINNFHESLYLILRQKIYLWANQEHMKNGSLYPQRNSIAFPFKIYQKSFKKMLYSHKKLHVQINLWCYITCKDDALKYTYISIYLYIYVYKCLCT